MAKISVNNLAYAIYESLENKDGSSFDKVAESAIKLLKDRHMLSKKDLILKKIQKIIDEKSGLVRVKINTGEKIDSKTEKEIEEFIKNKYKAKEVILKLKEDDKLLGGVKVEVGDEIIDLTLKNRLNQLQNYLLTN